MFGANKKTGGVSSVDSIRQRETHDAGERVAVVRLTKSISLSLSGLAAGAPDDALRTLTDWGLNLVDLFSQSRNPSSRAEGEGALVLARVLVRRL
jgi:hypothetical protein